VLDADSRLAVAELMSAIGTKPESRRVCSHGGDRGSSRPRLNVRQSTQLTGLGHR